jgi:hypothetical protein
MTNIEIAKQLMSRKLIEEPAEYVSKIVKTHESQFQLTYELNFTNIDGDLVQGSFTVYDHGAIDHPIIIVNSDGELWMTEFGCKSPDEDFYSDYWANIFLDSFYAWRTPFMIDADKRNAIKRKRNTPQELDGKLEW